MESPKKSPATDLDKLEDADQKSVQLFWKTDHFWKRLGKPFVVDYPKRADGSSFTDAMLEHLSAIQGQVQSLFTVED